jgi:hypothetical protein
MFRMTPTWQTRDGRLIPICNMETDHIKNTIAMLRGKGFIAKSECPPFPSPATGMNGEMAEYYAEQSYDTEVIEYMAKRGKVHKALDYLEAELRGRP